MFRNKDENFFFLDTSTLRINKTYTQTLDCRVGNRKHLPPSILISRPSTKALPLWDNVSQRFVEEPLKILCWRKRRKKTNLQIWL